MKDMIGEPMRQCGVCGWYGTAEECNICKFVKAAVAAEREACAKIAEANWDGSGLYTAERIRARGNPVPVESDESYEASEALHKIHQRRETREPKCPTNPPS